MLHVVLLPPTGTYTDHSWNSVRWHQMALIKLLISSQSPTFISFRLQPWFWSQFDPKSFPRCVCSFNNYYSATLLQCWEVCCEQLKNNYPHTQPIFPYWMLTNKVWNIGSFYFLYWQNKIYEYQFYLLTVSHHRMLRLINVLKGMSVILILTVPVPSHQLPKKYQCTIYRHYHMTNARTCWINAALYMTGSCTAWLLHVICFILCQENFSCPSQTIYHNF